MKKTALITGAAGFVGQHVCLGLLHSGWQVIGVDNFDPFYDRSIKEKRVAELRSDEHFDFHDLDIRNTDSLQRIFRDVDLIIHLAARPGVRQSIGRPLEYVSLNVAGTVSVLEAARATGVRRLIYSSSSSVYGPDAPLPFREDGPVGPLSPYSVTKLAGEQFCEVYARMHGFRVAILRLFTVYGPGQRPDLAIRRFTARLLSGEPLVMFGDGSSKRDYTHVEDIVRGVLEAVQWVSNGASTCEVFNLGRGAPVTLKRVIALVAEAVGVDPQVKQDPPAMGDLTNTWADTGKAEDLLGYRPSISVDEGIPDFVKWYEATYGRTA